MASAAPTTRSARRTRMGPESTTPLVRHRLGLDNRYLHDKLLVPFLGDQYGAELKSGKLKIKFDPDEGSLAIWAYDAHKLPLCPLHIRACRTRGRRT